MTTPDRSPFGDATEADVVEQRIPVDDVDDDAWRESERVSEDRDWEASEADLIEQAIDVPDDGTEFDR
ncbi:hypothetical protein Mycch_2856 [Mycolicibacterium chubuense NBB4]|uniref:Uncharacterized protein n=1 Tax=Mycolicibacterium chubuense (strain NBB4) TaxID=710421 RepID=I4BK10_MYCCN|nr:hypothetical protein [Mycolicibacterium chubuense]AFM17617.1 hypothetical protein Mycch_2856 [Mycolicibacterium chubuense NBB4]